MEKEYEKIELRSDKVQEVLSRPPKWIVRWGITVIFVIISVIIIGSWFFKYPDIVSAQITLTTENPPAPIVAKTSGKIQNLFIANNELVKKGKVLGVLENPASFNSVQIIEEELAHYKQNFVSESVNLIKYQNLTLGEIQPFYSMFYKYVNDYNNTVQLNYYQRKIKLYNKELKKHGQYLKNIKVQNEILKEELQLELKQFNRDSVLFTQALMSESEYEGAKADLLAKEYSYEQNNLSVTNTEIQIENLNQNILELKLQKEREFSELENLIWESYENLLASIGSWKHRFILTAPTEGIVTFNEFWNENQTVNVGEVVMTVIPEDEGEIIGKVKLDFQGAGKVKQGQQANIQFANYPYMEFGMVKGTVNTISLAPNNNFYTVEVKLNDGLTTFYGIDLEFKQEMQGIAEIITEDIRLIERIIRPLRHVLNKNTKFGSK